MKYYITNARDQALSSFYHNDVKPRLCFRQSDAYFFDSPEEAERFLNHIQGYARENPAILKLRISTYAKGFTR